jgi:hypothetical protein
LNCCSCTPAHMTKADVVDFLIDFSLGGISGAVAKTITAPIERVKLIIQTQVRCSYHHGPDR